MPMMIRSVLKMLALAALIALLPACAGAPGTGADRARAGDRPNILVIYADDIGYGDVSAYGGLIETPNIDRLARGGRMFTRAHASSATCTPSRYSLLTGRYPFRNERAEILAGDAPLLIEPGSLTLPGHLRAHGYHTEVVGKWHLGLGDGDVDWNGRIEPGPLEIGFDASYLLPATGDRVPCVYVDGHAVENLDPADPLRVSYKQKIGDWPTGTENPELRRYPADPQHSGTIVNGVSRIGWQSGGASALWVDEEMAERFTARAIRSIEAREEAGEPWFLFFSLHQPHVPRMPNPRFIGASGFGLRGDAILEADWSVGQLLDALDRLGAAEDTLVIFSSDNGPVMNDGYADGAMRDRGDHDPSGVFRGGKYTLWEGGTRVPFIVRWPGRVDAGSSSGALVCQVDLLATLGTVAGAPLTLAQSDRLDSVDVSAAMVGGVPEGRVDLVTQGVGGVALHEGNWKYIPADPSRAGFARHWSTAKHAGAANPLNSPPVTAEAYLFDLNADPGETRNVIGAHPDIAARMRARLDRVLRDAGDTFPAD